eukprot:jgi/Tetstr1/421380/TSEL_012349.t1
MARQEHLQEVRGGGPMRTAPAGSRAPSALFVVHFSPPIRHYSLVSAPRCPTGLQRPVCLLSRRSRANGGTLAQVDAVCETPWPPNPSGAHRHSGKPARIGKKQFGSNAMQLEDRAMKRGRKVYVGCAACRQSSRHASVVPDSVFASIAFMCTCKSPENISSQNCRRCTPRKIRPG